VDKLLIFLGMGLVTYLTRYTMIAALGREMPPGMHRWLRYVPPAVLAALIAPAVLAPQGQLEVGVPFWSVLVSVPVAWRTRSIFLTILAGMGAFWVLRVLGF
jgi:branched-subunit amino acid transport protein